MGKPVSDTKADLEIQQFLKQVIKRDSRQRAWKLLGFYGLVGSGLCLAMNLISLFVPFYYGGILAVVVLPVTACIGSVHFFLGRADEKKAARLADNTGLKERISTALEGRGSEDSLRLLQREDACRCIRGYSFTKWMPYVYPWKQYIVAGSLVVLAILAALFPSPAKDQAKQKHKLAVAAADVENKIKETKKELEKQAEEGKIEEDSLKKIEEALEAARKEIKAADDVKEIAEVTERLETKLVRDISETMSKETAESLQGLVQGNDLAALLDYQQRLSQLAQSGEAVAAAMDELKNLGELLDDYKKERLLSALEEAAKDGNISSDELSAALDKLNDANASYASVSISQNNGNGNAANMQNGDAGQGTNQNGEQGTGQQGDSQTAGGQSGGQGADEQGAGQGGSEQGGNQGTGQQGNSQTGGNGLGLGMNRGSSEGMERADASTDAEEVWIPDSIGDDENLTGQKSGTSGNKTKTKTSAGSGQKAEIGSVSGQYQQRAYSKLDKQKVPESKQDLVKKYFSGLE